MEVLLRKGNVDRLYLPRKEDGGVLLRVKDVVNIEERNLTKYISESYEILHEMEREKILRG